MDKFDLKKYLAEGKLIEENMGNDGYLKAIYDWLEDARLNKKLGSLQAEKKVKKQLKHLSEALNIIWIYKGLIDENIPAEQYFK